MKKTILIILMVIFSNSCAIYYGEEYFKSPDFDLKKNRNSKIGFIVLDNGKIDEMNLFKKYKNFDNNDEFIDYLYSESSKQFKAHGINVEEIILSPKIRKMNLINQKKLKAFQYFRKICQDNNKDFIFLISSWKINHDGSKYSTTGKLIQMEQKNTGILNQMNIKSKSVVSLRISVFDLNGKMIFTGQAFGSNYLGFLRTGEEFLVAVNNAVENMVKMFAGEFEKKNVYKNKYESLKGQGMR